MTTDTTYQTGLREYVLPASRMPLAVLYPTIGAEQPAKLGRFPIHAAREAEPARGSFPLVVISHGSGGSHLVYRTLAAHLARIGFVVAMPEHPGNNRNNNELAGTVQNLANRPRHVRMVIDWMEASDFGPILAGRGVAIIGHSLGGYTALALAGGRPEAFAHETPEKQARPIEVEADARVKALVLLAPAVAWFLAPGALAGVRVPILMLTAEKDVQTPVGHAEVLKRGLPDIGLLRHREVSNAGHYSFLSPFPPEMVSAAFAPSQDPPGFDRARFHEEMNGEVLAFLQSALGG